MKIAELAVVRRDNVGKGLGQLRASGWVPAIIYGKGIDNIPISVKLKDFLALLKAEHGEEIIINLSLNGQKHAAIVKEVQRHPISRDVLHIDFHKISMEEEITAHVHLEFVGTAVGVKEGGVLTPNLRSIEVQCLPRNLPDFIEVDVSDLGIGDVLKVADLPKIEGVRYLADDEEVVVTVAPPTELAEAPAEEAEEATGEPEVVKRHKEEAEQ